MFVLGEPSSEQIAEVVESCDGRSPNHPLLATASLVDAPPGFRIDGADCLLGQGDVAWASAREAIDRRVMYPAGWASVHTSPGAIAVGAPLVSVLRHFGFFSILPGRVREVFDEREGEKARYGFSFLTLEGHAEQGVERFVVTRDAATDDVRYELTSISRPAGFVRLATPVARLLQRRFRRDSVASIRRFVTERGDHT